MFPKWVTTGWMLAVAFSSLTFAIFIFLAVRTITTLLAIRRRRRHLVQNNDQLKLFENDASPWNMDNFRTPSILIVLGSGGHTAEMLTLVSEMMEHLPKGTKLTYVTGATDHHSASKAGELHKGENEACVPSYVTLPRAREVGQPWLSSALSSAKTSLAAIALVWRTKPDIVLTNGPGTSTVVAFAAFLRRVLLPSSKRCCHVIYVESFARVVTLSLSGKLVYGFADRFVVQWQQLCAQWPLAEYYGRLC